MSLIVWKNFIILVSISQVSISPLVRQNNYLAMLDQMLLPYFGVKHLFQHAQFFSNESSKIFKNTFGVVIQLCSSLLQGTGSNCWKRSTLYYYTLLLTKKLQFKMHFCKSSLAVAKNCEPTILRHLRYLSLFIKTKVTLVLNYETLPSANLRANLTCVLLLYLKY